LTAEQRQEVTAALAGLYKLAGIDLVREQVRANLPSAVNGFDLTADNLVLWLDHRNGQAIYYDLANINGQLRPRTPDGNYTGNGPVLDSSQLIFAQSSLTWDQWVESWRLDQAGKAPPNLFNGKVRLLPAEEAPLPGTSA
jgi:hypothetical protein